MKDPKRVPITFPRRLYKALRMAAARDDCSMATIVRTGVLHYLQDRHPDLLIKWFTDSKP